MKKTFLKDTFREIKKTIGRFLAILFIVALGTAFFVGVKVTCPDMKLTADKYYHDNNLMDFRLLSTVGFTNNDIEAIKQIKGVKTVMPGYSVDAVSTFKGKERVLAISSISINDMSYDNPDFINRPRIISGRLPQKSGECVIETNVFTQVLPNIGDKIKLSSGNDTDLSEKLNTLEYTVVGIVSSPLYVSKDRGTTTIGNGQVSAFMIIPDIDFNYEYYTTVYITADIDPNIAAYSTQYDDAVEPIQTTLDDFSKDRADFRYNDIKSEAEDTINEKQGEYNDSLKEADEKFADAENKINENQKKLDNAAVLLAQSKVDFQNAVKDAQDKIDSAASDLANAQKEYAPKLKEYNAKLDEYTSNLKEFNDQKQKAIDAGAYEMFKGQLDQAQKTLDDAKEKLDDAKAKLDDAKEKIDQGYKDLDDAKQKLIDSTVDAQNKIDEKQTELRNAQNDLDDAKAEFETTKQDTYQKLDDAKAKLDDAHTKINDIPKVTWYVLGRDKNPGYMDYSNAADRMDAISKVFPVIFIIVAILICLTSMGRMVEEQRQYMGTAKALGYNKSSIAVKFILYALLASVLGGVLGLVAGFTIFPITLNRAYSILYTMPKLILVIDYAYVAGSLIVGILVTTLSALFVCLGELNSNAAALMRPRAPRAGKMIFLEKIKFIWNRLKFTQKVAARNIIRYKNRFFMTVFGVAGCTALLLVGFGLSDAITAIGDIQYNELYICQMNVNLKDNITFEQRNNILNEIKKQPELSSVQQLLQKSVTVGGKTLEKDCTLIVPEDTEALDKYIMLRDRTTHNAISLTDDSAVITEKLAKTLGVKPGDTFYIKNGDYERISVKVGAVCENYLLHFIYLSPNLYEKLYGESPDFNQFVLRLTTTDASAQQNVSKNIVTMDGIMSVNLISDNMQRFKDIIRSIYNIVLVLIVSAGLLSFTVLFTLTNININERIREIATIKVLGFFDHEVSLYVFRENIILTIIGTIIGLFLGVPLARYVIGTAEVDMIMFGREIYPLSFLLAAVFTIAFALLVNFVMIKRLKKINMVEALKTVE